MKHKLSVRLTAMVTALLIFLVVMVVAIFSQHTNDIMVTHHDHVITSGVENVAKTLSKTMPETCTSENFLEIIQQIDGMEIHMELLQGVTYYRVLVGDSDFHYLELKDGQFQYLDGSEVKDYTSQVLKKALKGSLGRKEIIIGEEHILTGGAPIYNPEGEIVGAILLQHRSTDAVDMQRQINQVLLMGSAISLIIALGCLVVLSRYFTRPIQKIEYAANELANGNLDIETHITSQNEVGQLAKSMDTLAGQLRQAREDRENEERLRDRFLADVSHDLKTPVTVIRASLEALCDGIAESPEDVDRYHRQMLAESCYLQKLIQDLLELTSLKNKEFPTKEETVNLSELMGDAAISARTMASSKGIVFCCSAPEKEWYTTGDYDLLRKLLMLILDNAIKYTEEGKRVFLHQEINGDIVIADEGKGISQEKLPHIFDRYFRADARMENGSAGLGLPIAKEIAERHHIQIQVESELGKGSRFCLCFENGSLRAEE